MANASYKLPDDFLLKLSKLGDRTDDILSKVLDAGGEVVAEKVASNLGGVIGQNLKEDSRSTGALASALGVSPAKQDKDGNFNVKIGFSEPHSGGKSNSMLAGVLEYGKHGQPAKPFLKPAKSSSKNAAISAMQAKFEEEVAKL